MAVVAAGIVCFSALSPPLTHPGALLGAHGIRCRREHDHGVPQRQRYSSALWARRPAGQGAPVTRSPRGCRNHTGAQVVGVVCGIVANLTIGPEGPMVHVGACCAAMVAKGLHGAPPLMRKKGLRMGGLLSQTGWQQ